MHQSVSYQYLVQRRRLHQEASLPVFWGENMSWPPWLLALKVHPNGTWREPERNLNPIPLIFTRRRETRVWTMEWECFISGGWDCWGVNMLLSWGFGLPMPLWVTTHPHINSFCWCLAWLLGSSGFQIPKPIQHDSPSWFMSCLLLRKIAGFLLCTPQTSTFWGLLTTTEPPNCIKLWCLKPKIRKMVSGQSTWTLRSSSNPLMVAGRVGGQVNAVNAGQGLRTTSDHVPCHTVPCHTMPLFPLLDFPCPATWLFLSIWTSQRRL